MRFLLQLCPMDTFSINHATYSFILHESKLFHPMIPELHTDKFTVPSQNRAHGRCTLHWTQTGGWADIRDTTVAVRCERAPRYVIFIISLFEQQALLLLISGTVTNRERGRPAIGPMLHGAVDGCRNSNGWFMSSILQIIAVRWKITW